MSIINALMTPYTDKPRHWCPQAEKYTGLDSLLSAIYKGWTINERVFRHETWRGGTRPVVVYYFELKFGERIVTMPVISNPCVVPLIDDLELQVITQAFWEKAH